MTAIPHNYFDTAAPMARVRINRHVILFGLLLIFTALLRFDGKQVNTVFYDEAIYATLGREVLAGDFSQHPITWTFGSPLYPVLSSLVNDAAGYTGLRLLSTVFSVWSAACVFLLAWRLFGSSAALWALALFAVAGPSISLGQMAVYDTLSVPLLASAMCCMVYSAYTYRWQTHLLLLGGCLAALSVLAKYTAVLMLPSLVLLGLVVYLARGRSFLALGLMVFPLALILLNYAVLNFSGLMELLQETKTITNSGTSPSFILDTVLVEVGLIVLVGALSLWLIPFASFYRERVPFGIRLVLAVVLPSLIVSLFAVPAYHILTQSVQSLWKHTVYMLLFFAPLAGFGFHLLIEQCRKPGTKFTRLLRGGWAFVTLVVMLAYLHVSLSRNWGLMRSWPNVTHVISHLQTVQWTRDTRLLAEQSAVYEYYFDLGAFDRSTWSNTFYFEYSSKTGIEAMLSAVKDNYFDVLVFDDYYTPAVNAALEEVLIKSGYELTFVDQPQTLSTGQEIVIRVYELQQSQEGNDEPGTDWLGTPEHPIYN
ncbi:MAG: glycosyltransferase family 39 protein [bacterium]|nr:glycosyltransferase family 39 protein [bacterium]